MAHGLRIDNGNGQRVIDSDYNGVYYIGKTSISSAQITQVPGYTNPTVPPLVFIKYPTTSGQYAQMTSLSFSTGIAPGGLGGATLTVPNDVIYAYHSGISGGTEEGFSTESQCDAVGGTWISGNSKATRCVRTTPLIVSTDTFVRGDPSTTSADRFSSNKLFTTDPGNSVRTPADNGYWQYNSESAKVSLTFDSTGHPTGATVVDSGNGWSIGEEQYLGNNGVYNLNFAAPLQNSPTDGWFPYDTSSPRWYHDTASIDTTVLPKITATSIASGWNAEISGNFTSSITLYFFGIGGNAIASNEYGLEILNSSGVVAFSSNRPPPVIRNTQLISFTDINYTNGTTVSSNQQPTNSDSSNIPIGSVAMSSLPVAPSSYSAHQQYTVAGSGNAPFWLTGIQRYVSNAGLNFEDSGGNLNRIRYGAFETGEIDQVENTDPCRVAGSTSIINVTTNFHSPFWDTGDDTNSANSGGNSPAFTTCNSGTPAKTNISANWSVSSECIFLDTTIYDALPY